MTQTDIVLRFDPAIHGNLIPHLAAIHSGCITHDRTLATFLPPLSHEKLLSYWKERIAEVSDGTRVIYILVKGPVSSTQITGSQVAGVAMLSMPFSETGAARGVVEKLLIHTNHRRRGGARTLLAALEDDAARRGRTMLTLDTETGSPAEEIYRKLGYIEVGKVPRYGKSPDGEYKSETFFYKQL